jgi:uncharacterized membrane protein
MNNRRINSIDFMRGLVIVIMAIDHIRDLLHTTSLSQDPLDLSTTTPALFMTRWITHFCAPVFVFLAGTSAYLYFTTQNDLLKAQRFLRQRGLLLMLLEVTVIGFGIWTDIYFRTVLFQVIFAIGSGLFILSFLLRVPARILGAIGLCIVAMHNLLPALKFENTFFDFARALLLDRGFFKTGEDRGLMVAYAVIPWLGVLLLGFAFGKTFTLPPEERRRKLLYAGGSALVIFAGLRVLNGYGDASHWSVQPSFLHTVFSFVDVTKYPPSLLYTAMTLCVMFFVLYLADGKDNLFINVFVTYGRVPLFFYITHWYIIHLSMFVMLFLQGIAWSDMPFGVMNFGRPSQGVGLELPYIYLYWICMVTAMYPLCKWYGKYKAFHPQKKLLKYL